MNERAERINGWAAMIGIVAAMGWVSGHTEVIAKIFG